MALPVRLPLTKVKRANKFNARKVDYDGHTFDSQKEFRRYQVLKDMETKGEIHGLRVHPKFEFKIAGRAVLTRSDGYPNGRQVRFHPDFQYIRPGFGMVTEDCKGGNATKTEAYRLRKAIFECLYWPVRVEEV